MRETAVKHISFFLEFLMLYEVYSFSIAKSKETAKKCIVVTNYAVL